MTPFLLLEELSKVLQEELALVLPGQDGKQESINYYLGAVPYKDGKNPDINVFPYIVLRFIKGEDTIDQGTLTIAIYIGVRSDDISGWKDLLHVMMMIRKRLQEYPTIDQCYRMEYPFKYEIFEGQPWPEWLGLITTTWTMAKPLNKEGQKAWGVDLP